MIKIVSAHEPLPEGQTVTGYLVSRNKPSQGDVIDCRRATLTRIYSGHGVVRAETGVSPKKGFGILISKAEISLNKIEQGFSLWLRVEG